MRKIIGGAIAAGIIFTPGPVLATNYSHDVDCYGMSINFSSTIVATDNHQITITVDGASESFLYDEAFSKVIIWDPTIAHDWTIVVDANRVKGNGNGADRTFSGESEPCIPTTTMPPDTIPPTTIIDTTIPVTTIVEVTVPPTTPVTTAGVTSTTIEVPEIVVNTLPGPTTSLELPPPATNAPTTVTISVEPRLPETGSNLNIILLAVAFIIAGLACFQVRKI